MTTTKEHTESTFPLVYQCRLSLSTRTVNHLAGLLRRHLKAIRSRWRILPPGKIAVIVLAVLRHDQRLADMAGGNNVSESTVRRWRDEVIDLLAAQAPRLDRALKKIARQGGEVVLIDGTLVHTQRRTGKDDRKNYSGKHRHHGLHFLALTDEKGRLVWISAARPGRTHDNTAVRCPLGVDRVDVDGLAGRAAEDLAQRLDAPSSTLTPNNMTAPLDRFVAPAVPGQEPGELESRVGRSIHNSIGCRYATTAPSGGGSLFGLAVRSRIKR
ncbi:transposase family protein [Streptomyces sp. NPDC014623]|uniref:transposase family protein n=1 Tax=Streptomyces sp. NPDC014623 TaxID=3364875 RepID=UPI0036FDEABB